MGCVCGGGGLSAAGPRPASPLSPQNMWMEHRGKEIPRRGQRNPALEADRDLGIVYFAQTSVL